MQRWRMVWMMGVVMALGTVGVIVAQDSPPPQAPPTIEAQEFQYPFPVEVLDGEQHEDVFPAAFMRGIVGVYAGDERRKPSATPVTW